MMKITIQLFAVLIFGLYSCAGSLERNTLQGVSDTVQIDTLWQSKIIKPESYWKKNLTENQFYILREKGTESPFSHPYNGYKKKGVYICAACNNPLYSSGVKFKSGTGWPSFWKPYFSKSVRVGADNSLGMTRDEVVCGRCEGHLGHVFNDGPQPTGLRYCMNGVSLKFLPEQNIQKAIFAQGCFWCVEEIFEAIKGVKEVVSGYAGGTEKNPTYQKVGAGLTSHAEAVEVTYDANEITYAMLLKVYFNSGDITQVNGQGNDKGPQYRSIVFYQNDKEKNLIKRAIQDIEESKKYTEKVAVEVTSLQKFYVAEEYHQDYVKLNPNQGYVKRVSIPRFQLAITKFPELLKK